MPGLGNNSDHSLIRAATVSTDVAARVSGNMHWSCPGTSVGGNVFAPFVSKVMFGIFTFHRILYLDSFRCNSPVPPGSTTTEWTSSQLPLDSWPKIPHPGSLSCHRGWAKCTAIGDPPPHTYTLHSQLFLKLALKNCDRSHKSFRLSLHIHNGVLKYISITLL